MATTENWVRMTPTWARWTAEEIRVLKALYETEPSRDRMMEQLPGRTWGAIQTKGYSLGLSRKHLKERPQTTWHIRQWEKDVLMELGPCLSAEELRMLMPCRSAGQITRMAQELGVELFSVEDEEPYE